MINSSNKQFMLRAIELAKTGIDKNIGGPFGAVIVKNGKIIGEGNNSVTSTNDPTAHAEIIAIRNACKNLDSFQLSNCEIYCTCEPCPMCLGAIYWARIDKIYYAANRAQAAKGGFDDEFIYNQISLTPEKRSIESLHFMESHGIEVFKHWIEKSDKIPY